MEVDTNELLHRIGAVLRVMSDKMDRLIEAANDHFAGANKMVADEPAKEPEPEHPAGPKPDPGEGYRLLSKEPLEELQPGDQIYSQGLGVWEKSITALAPRQRREPQSFRLWYRRKIEASEPPKAPQPQYRQYREPVLPADAGKVCEFSINGNDWTEGTLRGYAGHLWQSVSSEVVGAKVWTFARIKKDA